MIYDSRDALSWGDPPRALRGSAGQAGAAALPDSAGDESFKCLTCQLPTVGYWPTVAMTGSGVGCRKLKAHRFGQQSALVTWSTFQTLPWRIGCTDKLCANSFPDSDSMRQTSSGIPSVIN